LTHFFISLSRQAPLPAQSTDFIASQLSIGIGIEFASTMPAVEVSLFEQKFGK
jgi:hypothetical protein